MNIAIIPARGGSKRIPRKNIKMFCGQPMIAYAIKDAQASGLFENVLVSTDDAEIQIIANSFGAETPFVRSAELANDFTATVPVVAHAIQACEALGWQFSNVCCIYPGVPFIEVGDLKGSLAQLTESGADYCFPVTEFPAAIQRALKHNSNGLMAPFYPEYELTRTQDLEAAFYDAGQFYWGTKNAWLTNSRIHRSGIGFEIPNWRVVDIDTPADWERAERLAASLFAH
ncbi:MAG: pseudaminic acid cytidylyltransferase [Burkholderiales bacterium]|nr:pseudaminic acid cytidylyltransferase [Burkholderiales bacterium]